MVYPANQEEADEAKRELDAYLALEKAKPWHRKLREGVNDLVSAHWVITVIVFGGVLVSVVWGACIAR